MTKIIYIDENKQYQYIKTEIIESQNDEMLKSHNAPKYIKFGDKFGFYKKSIASTPTLDKFEFIISELGKELSMKMANSYIAVDEDNNMLGVISETVLQPKEELIEFNSPKFVDLIDRSNPEIIAILERIQTLPYNTTLDNPEDIYYILDIFPKIVSSFANPNEVEELINDYYKMLMFDLITGNQDRNRNNFAVIKDENNNYKFSPLFDNSTINLKNTEHNFRNVMGFRIKDEDILKYLLEYRRDIIEPLLQKIEDEDYINNIITTYGNDLLTENEQSWISNRIATNIAAINKYKTQFLTQ